MHTLLFPSTNLNKSTWTNTNLVQQVPNHPYLAYSSNSTKMTNKRPDIDVPEYDATAWTDYYTYIVKNIILHLH